jgi:uncharacterized protein (DUF983 family)
MCHVLCQPLLLQYLEPATEAAEETSPEVAEQLPKDWPASECIYFYGDCLVLHQLKVPFQYVCSWRHIYVYMPAAVALSCASCHKRGAVTAFESQESFLPTPLLEALQLRA